MTGSAAFAGDKRLLLRLSFFILILAAFLRFTSLDLKPPHHDEGVNGSFVSKILATGFYNYDPENYHGPLQFYMMLVSERLFGKNIVSLRLPSALFSMLCILWMFKFSRFLGWRVAYFSAAAMAVSPAFVFYGRYAIHETSLVFFNILMVWSLFGLRREGKAKYLWALGLGVTGMILTKETYIFHIVCLLPPIFYLMLNKIIKTGPSERSVKREWKTADLRNVLFLCIFLILFFYSGNFFNWKELPDIYRTFFTWFKTGVVSAPHKKPFFYWFGLIKIYEVLALLGLGLAFLWVFFAKSLEMRLIAIYGLAVFLVYSVIPYKTPWCVINLLWPFYFVLGDTLARLFDFRPSRNLCNFFVVILLMVSLGQAIRLNFFRYENEKEPYVYTHTFNEINKLMDPLKALKKIDPAVYDRLKGNILCSGSTWPLPWMLSDIRSVGYYGKSQSLYAVDADFIFAEKGQVFFVEQNLKERYFTQSLRLNSVQNPSKLYLNYGTFKEVFPGIAPDFVPKPVDVFKPGQGLFVVFYPNVSWQGKPALRNIFQKADLSWNDEAMFLPAPRSGIFSGEIYLSLAMTQFLLMTDDGGFLEIDGKRVIDDPGPHAASFKEGVVSGITGWKRIRIGFFDQGGGAVLKLFWKDASGNSVEIPSESLRIFEKDLRE